MFLFSGEWLYYLYWLQYKKTYGFNIRQPLTCTLKTDLKKLARLATLKDTFLKQQSGVHMNIEEVLLTVAISPVHTGY